jgi:hypothetical protein
MFSAQPFRYISGEDSQKDSIKLLGIRSYKEYTAPFNDSTQRILTTIVEYDEQGNQTRNFSHDPVGGWENQYTWKFDENNREIEKSYFSPDSNTYLQRFYSCYDEKGNLTEYVVEHYGGGQFVGNSRTVNEYDSVGHLISLKVYSKEGLHTHYEYRYHPSGYRTEELVFSPEGKLLWRRAASSYEREEPYGFPTERDPETEKQFVVTITIDPQTGNTIYSDGFGIRIFNAKNMLIYWCQSKYRYHWYEYTFY